VYVIGEVLRPGSVELVNSETVSITKVLAAAGGKTRTALASKAMIRRIGSDASQGAAKIDLDKIMSGKAADLELAEGDVLVIPSNQLMTYLQNVSLTAINAGIFAGFQVLARY
jgi:protein involved in polysaccharide export with SLBB domain